jgi:hypothetical protein
MTATLAIQQKEAFNRDYVFGRKAEEDILGTIRTFFSDPTITPSTDKYDRYDFTGAGRKYELKTRRLTRERFATTMLPLGKLLSENPEGNIFLFQYTDGLYYIPYNAEQFSNFNVAPYCRQDRMGYDTEQDYIYIPVNLLTKII